METEAPCDVRVFSLGGWFSRLYTVSFTWWALMVVHLRPAERRQEAVKMRWKKIRVNALCSHMQTVCTTWSFCCRVSLGEQQWFLSLCPSLCLLAHSRSCPWPGALRQAGFALVARHQPSPSRVSLASPSFLSSQGEGRHTAAPPAEPPAGSLSWASCGAIQSSECVLKCDRAEHIKTSPSQTQCSSILMPECILTLGVLSREDKKKIEFCLY